MVDPSDLDELLRTLRRALREKVVALLAEMDERQELPESVRQLFVRLGLFALVVPEAYGGLGLNLTHLCRVIEEVATVDASLAVLVQAPATALRPLLLAGTPEQQARYFGEVASRGALFAFGLTEPQAGSDAASLVTRAERAGDGYILSGQKRFVTNGDIADYYVVFGRTGAGRGGISAFVIPAGAPGLSAGKHESKMGLRASPTTDLFLEGVRVLESARIGAEGEGFGLLTATFTTSRPTIAAQAVGLAQAALDAACAYALERRQFGRAIADFQGLRFLLADMATEIEAARALTYLASGEYDAGRPSPALAAMAKCFASDVAMRVATDAVQVFGGYGFLKDYGVERLMRDAKITQIYEGTNQIMRVIIARELLKKPGASPAAPGDGATA
ncbi:MAG: acyl-CoA dehydrogenase family protein [Candidatus Rokubacteria bacterium]|nr:acyl-CoA dehydrogenase family protein [Candidatus Rokubacteria bacterium]